MSGLCTKVRVLAAKLETTVGTAIALDAAAGAFRVYDYRVKKETEFETREGQGAASRISGSDGAQAGSISFKLDMYGGAGKPTWADTLLPACGLVATGNVFTPLTAQPGTTTTVPRTVTIGIYENGRLRTLFGAMGNAKFMFERGKMSVIEFEFKGIFAAPTDTAIVAPTYDTTQPPRFTSSGLTLGAWTPRVPSIEIDLGNDVQLREDVTTASGYYAAFIADRVVTGKMNPESELVADNDTYGQLLAGTQQALSFNVGGASGDNTMQFSLPKCQFTSIDSEERGGIEADPVEFQCLRSASAGEDEFSLTFGAT